MKIFVTGEHDLVIHLAVEIDVQESIKNPTFVNKVK